jgi:hypothetical protein
MTEKQSVQYLGEFDVDIAQTPYAGFTSQDWATLYIFSYGQIDGAHHKQWVLDQVSRILHGTPVIVTVRKWDNGNEEFSYNTGEPSQAYLDWVEEYLGEYHEESDSFEYSYDEGIAP